MRPLTLIRMKQHIVKYKMAYIALLVVVAFAVLGFYKAVDTTADFIAQDIYTLPVDLK